MHDPHQAFFDRLASEWDLTFTSEDLERLDHIVAKLRIRTGWDVLDLGCGTGILFDMLRRRIGRTGTLVGLDFSIEMAETARRNFPFSNISVVDADASMLPFKDGSFDMAIAFAAFPHFVHPERVLAETHRVLKSGAPFHVIHLMSSGEIAAMHSRVGGVVGKDLLPSKEKMLRMLESSRFSHISIEDHPGLYVASALKSE